VVARTTHAASVVCPARRAATNTQFADTSSGTAYASEKAAVVGEVVVDLGDPHGPRQQREGCRHGSTEQVGPLDGR
jgi:hypothetical protein